MRDSWKYSSLRFYVLNYSWNFKFWFFSKKKYKQIVYSKGNSLSTKAQEITKRRFEGYEYNDTVYLDNPGIPDIPSDVWKVWKNKKLIS